MSTSIEGIVEDMITDELYSLSKKKVVDMFIKDNYIQVITPEIYDMIDELLELVENRVEELNSEMEEESSEEE
jgi:hypothetical protein